MNVKNNIQPVKKKSKALVIMHPDTHEVVVVDTKPVAAANSNKSIEKSNKKVSLCKIN